MQAYVAQASETMYDEFVERVWRELAGHGSPAPDEAVGEHPAQPQPVAYAISRDSRFAAFRWWLPAAQDESLSCGCCDAFIVPTATPGQLRLGLAIRVPQLDRELSPGAVESLLEWGRQRELQLEAPARPLPGFVELSALLAARGAVSTSSAQLLAQLQEAQESQSHLERLVDEQEAELRDANAQLEQLREALIWAGARVPDVAEAEASPGGEEPAEWQQYPDDFEQLPSWCEALGDRLAVLPRALSGAKKALYERPQLVYASLAFLAGPYRDARMGLLDAAGLQAALDRIGVRLRGSVGASIAGEQGDAYYVAWAGRRRFLDLHLLRGGGRDERYCLRVYFFWDEASKRCVVGWLPSHLDNSLS
ncbi:hypothetical protein D3C71_25060 [compost metagenome]